MPPAFKLVALDSIDSTNVYAKQLAEEGCQDNTLVWAKQQSSGRGRRGREWVSSPGNVYLSLISRPGCSFLEASNLSFLTSLVVCDAIEAVGGPYAPKVQCKWPNDVLVEDKKVSGILLECAATVDPIAKTPDWVVIGVGINVFHYPENTEYPATALGDIYTVEAMVTAFAEHFQIWLDRWREFGFSVVREAWMKRAKGIGDPITARLPEETIDGIFKGLGPEGALILEAEGKERHITAADVFFPVKG